MPITKEILSKYANKADIFIESGTYKGDTVNIAIELGFKEIYTIELNENFYKLAKIKFEKYPQVTCILGDSQDKLPEILEKITKPAIFWLDGHWSMGDTSKGKNAVPLLQELDIIAKYKIKNHTILIDDIRLLSDKNEIIIDWSLINISDIENRCKLINDKYKITYEDDILSKNDILVATL